MKTSRVGLESSIGLTPGLLLTSTLKTRIRTATFILQSKDTTVVPKDNYQNACSPDSNSQLALANKQGGWVGKIK
jgi:hypothetical protein